MDVMGVGGCLFPRIRRGLGSGGWRLAGAQHEKPGAFAIPIPKEFSG